MYLPASRQDAVARDLSDPLGDLRDAFILPREGVYLVGHSLGPPTRRALKAVKAASEAEWAAERVGAWNSAGWFDLPNRLGDRLAALIGAQAGEVVFTDTVSTNLFKLAGAALPLSAERHLYVDADEFPTDQYIIEALGALSNTPFTRVEAPDVSIAARGGVYIKSVVSYRSGARVDMTHYEDAARKSGGRMVWDLSHATGVAALDMGASGAALAAGCSYKYLNGGPGAPAFIYAREDIAAQMTSPLPGWMGHAKPFDFMSDYRPAAGARRFASGTPPILSLRALEGALASFEGLDMGAVTAKAGALGDLCIARAESLGIEVMSPAMANQRGGHISLRIDNGYPVSKALHALGYSVDFRTPDTIRLGLSPLYVRFSDVWDVMGALSEIVQTRSWDRPEFLKLSNVT